MKRGVAGKKHTQALGEKTAVAAAGESAKPMAELDHCKHKRPDQRSLFNEMLHKANSNL